MADFTQAVVTNAGAAAEATAITNGWTILFTRVQVGKGTTLGSTDPKTLTALLSPVVLVAPDPNAPSANLIGINNLVTYQVSIRFEVNSAWVTTQFQLAEAGLFARLNNGAEFLYAYAYAGTNGDIITASGSGSPVDNQYTFLIPYSNAPTIAVTLGVFPQVNLHAVNHLDNGIDPLPVATSSRTGSVPRGSGSGTNVLCDTSPVTFIPYTPLITVDTTLFVALGNPNTAPNFSSIQNALNYLGGFSIASGARVTINVAAGLYTSSSAISISHVNASQILITGPQNAAVSFTGIGTITGSAGNWNVQLLGVSDISRIDNVLSRLLIFSTSGMASLANTLLCGFFNVVSISGSTVTIFVPYKGAAWPSFTGFTGGSAVPITAILQGPATNNVVNCDTHGIGMFEYIGIIPPAAGMPSNIQITGFNSAGPCNLTLVGVKNLQNNTTVCAGFSLSNTATLKLCASSGNNNGFVCLGSVNLYFCAGTHNTSFGLWVEGGGSAVAVPIDGPNNCFMSGNNAHGIIDNDGSYLSAVSSWINNVLAHSIIYSAYNTNSGMAVASGSRTASSSTSDGMNSQFNGANDVTVSGFGINNMTIFGSRIFSQTAGVLTAAGIING